MPLSEQTQTMSNDQAFSKEQEMEHACHITSFFWVRLIIAISYS